MAWTVTENDDAHDLITVKAVLSTVNQQDQLRNLIAALQKRITEEKTDDRPVA